MKQPKYLQHILIGATSVALVGARIVSDSEPSGAGVTEAASFMPGVAQAASLADVGKSTAYLSGSAARTNSLAFRTKSALEALAPAVRAMSHPQALEDAFSSYFAYKAANPGQVRKPYLYFVDYGLPSTTPRGYVFDMDELEVVEGPFTVAHGRGSARPSDLVPSRFSNASGSNATSLGLYLAQETYRFNGKSGGRRYSSVGLRLKGLSRGFNDNARARGVVAHGAPYVTASRAGRSEGCPAVEQSLAHVLLPKLANGGMVFLFAPDRQWMASDPWVATAKTLASAESAPSATRTAN